jgi:hypothetical protein
MRAAAPIELGLKMPAFSASEPIGLAARVTESGLDAQVVVPSSVAQSIGQFLAAIQEMLQGGGLGLPLP